MHWIIVFFILIGVGVSWADEPPAQYDDHGKRDPFWRLVSAGGAILNYDNDLSISDMILEGIIQDRSGKNLAIINSKVVTVGDKVGLFVVLDIGRDGVTLNKGQETFVLKLKKEQ